MLNWLCLRCLRHTGSGSVVGRQQINSLILSLPIAHFGQWCLALKVDTFDKLCDLVVLEQFMNTIPPKVAVPGAQGKCRGIWQL